MKNSEKRKKVKKFFDNLIKFLSASGTFLAAFTALWKIELSWSIYIIVSFIFLILLTSIIAIFIWEDKKIKMKLEKKENKYRKEIKKGKKGQVRLILKKDKAIMAYKKGRKANRSKLFTAVLLAVAFFVFCIGQTENTKAAMQWVKQLINNEKTDNMEAKDNDIVNKDNGKIPNFDASIGTGENPDSNRVRKQEGYNFVLKETNRNPKLEKEIENQIYFWRTGGVNGESEETVSKMFVEQSHEERSNADLKKISSKFGYDFDSLEEAEAEFKSKVDECKNIEYEADWIASAPDSDELDNYIEARRQLNSMKIDGAQGCYILCWRLANDYQYYALEYEAQTENAQAIYYYYSMSIYYCMESLKYDITDSERTRAENYLLSRYEDLARDDCIVNKKYKDRAGEIAEILKNIL